MRKFLFIFLFMLISYVPSSSLDLYSKVEIPTERPKLPVLKCKRPVFTEKEVLNKFNEFRFKENSKEVKKINASRVDPLYIVKKFYEAPEGQTLTFFKVGTFLFRDLFDDEKQLWESLKKTPYVKLLAEKEIEKYLREKKLLPENAEKGEERELRLPSPDDPRTTVPVGISVNYVHNYKGVPIGIDLINVTYMGGKVCQVSYSWSEIEPKDEPAVVLPARVCAESAVKYAREVLYGNSPYVKIYITKVELVYYPQNHSDLSLLYPCWAFEFNNGEYTVYVNGFTSKVAKSHYFRVVEEK